MANSIEEILGRNINSVKELKAAIKELQDSLVGVDAESEQFKTTSEQLAAAQAELNKVTRAGKDDNNAAADSIRGMEKEYKALYDTYKMLSEEQRNSDFGKNMAESLEQMSTKINEAKKDVGNFKDNIGRYAQSATEAFNSMGVSVGGLQAPLKAATGGAKTFGTALKTLAANPIVLVITALVAILAKAADAIKKNEELTQRLHQAMSVFKPVLDAVSNAFDFLAGILVKTIEGLSRVAEKIMSIIPGMKQAIQSHKELAKATDELTKRQREAEVENSKKAAEIERLREEASAVEDVNEKRRLLEEAKALQAEIDQENIAIAQEELRIMEEYGDKTANSAEENEALAAAQKKVNDAIAQGERNMRMYNKQLDATETKTKSATSSGKNYREEAKKLYDQLVENSKTEVQQLTEKYEKEKKLLEKYNLDTTLLTKKYNKEVMEIRITEWKKEKDNLDAIFQGYSENVKRYYENQKKLAKAYEDDAGLFIIDAAQISDALGRLEQFRFDVNKILSATKDDMHVLLETLFENGDMTKITDYNYVEQILNSYVDDDNLQSVMNLFHTFGEIGWGEFVETIEQGVKNLNSTFDLNLKNLPDVETALATLGHDMAEKFGDAAQAELDSQKRTMTLTLYEDLYRMLKNGAGDSTELFQMLQTLPKEAEYAMLEYEKDSLQIQLDNFSGTTEQKIAILQHYYEVVSALRQADFEAEALQLQRTEEIWDASFDHFDAWTSSLDSVLGTIGSIMQAEIDSGKLTEKEAKKKQKTLENLQKVQLAVAIANIAANTAAGIMDVWRGYAAELPLNAETAAATGPAAAATKAALDAKSLASAIIKTSAIGVQGSAQLAAAIGGYITKSTAASSMDNGGGSAGVGATPTLIDSTPYSYTRTVQTTEEEDRLNQPIWVSVEDISSGLGRQVQVTDESSF